MNYQSKYYQKRYEISNHLGNVLAVVNDKLDVVCEGDTVSYFKSEVLYAYDYSPFGAILEDRKYVADSTCTTIIDYDTTYNDHYEVTFTLTTMLAPGETIRLDNGGGTTKTLATYNAAYVSIFSYKGQIISNVSPAADGIMYIPQGGATVKLRFSADSLGFQCGDEVHVYSGATSLTSVTIDCAIDSIYAVDTIISCSSSDYRFGFNGMEKDNSVKGTGNSYDFGARIYDSRLGRWMSLDPLMNKYPSESPFCFVGNSPLVIIDPDGREKIVVIGQPGKHNNKENFTITALDRAKRLKEEAIAAANGTKTPNTIEGVTMLLYVSTDAEQIAKGYAFSPEQVKAFQKQADAEGIKLITVNSNKEIINYINTKDKNLSLEKEADVLKSGRNGDLITNFTWVGHSGINSGGLAIDYTTDFNDGSLYVSEFSGLAFSDDCDAHLENGCNTLNPYFHSQGEVMATKVGGTVYGSTSTTDYSGTMPGRAKSEEELQDVGIDTEKGTGGRTKTLNKIAKEAAKVVGDVAK